MLAVREHAQSGYAPRTRHNASRAEMTVAFAVNFETAGERLTRKAAGGRYVGIPLQVSSIEATRKLYSALRSAHAHILNIAGNGIATLSRHGWTQDRADQAVFEVISLVHKHWPLRLVVTGGQTGIDMAGAIAAVALGIDVEVTMPPGFLQRHADNVDLVHTEAEIRAEIEQRVAMLKPNIT